MDPDWRWEMLDALSDLKGVRFQFRHYREYRPGWDHDHCVACFAEFAERDFSADEPVLKQGFATCADFIRGAEYNWVCAPCFADFRERMGWREAPPDAPRAKN